MEKNNLHRHQEHEIHPLEEKIHLLKIQHLEVTKQLIEGNYNLIKIYNLVDLN